VQCNRSVGKRKFLTNIGCLRTPALTNTVMQTLTNSAFRLACDTLRHLIDRDTTIGFSNTIDALRGEEMNMMVKRNGSVRLAVYMAVTVLGVAGSIIVALAVNHPAAVTIPIVAVFCCLTILVRLHSRVTRYSCPKCDHQFSIGPITDLISPHVPDSKLLVCPECKQRNWCEVQSDA
jgi:hypothetical protein